MFKKTIFFFIKSIFFIIYIQNISAQTRTKITVEEYIEKYKDIAQAHMKEYKIPASIKLAQAILESGSGNSDLAVNANNHFGIKCHKDWQGGTYHKDDDAKDECFRKYKNPKESYVDHSIFLTTRSRYAALFELDITDYKAWAKGLKDAGYATNPRYPESLINLIEKYNLSQYDTETPILADKGKNEKYSEGKNENIKGSRTSKRQIMLNNKVKYVIARKNDTFLSLAAELEMGAWQFYKYNDLNKNSHIKVGQIIYLQPKRRRSYEHKLHVVLEGETLYDVSQKYAVKVKHLHRLNSDLHPDGDIVKGQFIWLQKK